MVGFLFAGVSAYLGQFLHGGVFRLGEYRFYFGCVAQYHSDLDEVFERDETFLLEAGDVADGYARPLGDVAPGEVLLDAAFLEIACHLYGNIIRIVKREALQ